MLHVPTRQRSQIHAWKPSVLLVSLKLSFFLPHNNLMLMVNCSFRGVGFFYNNCHLLWHANCFFDFEKYVLNMCGRSFADFFCSKYSCQSNFVVGGKCIHCTFSLIPTYNNILLMEQIRPKNQLRLVVYRIIYWVSYMLGGARLLPSTVLHLMSWWKQMTQSTFSPSPPRAELFVDPSASLSAWKATRKKKQRHIESCL